MKNRKIIEWILRIAVAGEFVGHGVFALQQKTSWLPYFNSVGISNDAALTLMPIIGIMDLLLAAIVIIKPIRISLIWMAFWGFWTALLRPIAGEPIWDFIERWANWGAPLALLFLYGWPKSFKDLWKH